MKQKANLTGQRFGALVVIGLAVDGREPKWLCKCDCGNHGTVFGSNLRKGYTRSCGCLRKEVSRAMCQSNKTHGKTLSRTYKSWQSLRQRCENPHNHNFHLYGGRGIAVCVRWSKFENFLADMGERPMGMTIDRINKDGNYEPGNCRWATPTEQSNNRRDNRLLSLSGEKLTVSQWARKMGLKPYVLFNHLDRGGSFEALMGAEKRIPG